MKVIVIILSNHGDNVVVIIVEGDGDCAVL